MPSVVHRRFAALLTALLLMPSVGSGHDYPTGVMKILHPWVDPVQKGSDRVVLSLRIVEISADDRLVGAETPVAERVDVAPATGIALKAGRDLTLSADGPHLLLRRVSRDLPFGYEYPMTLHFERAGAVEAGLIITPDD